jgi:hypothetical protein
VGGGITSAVLQGWMAVSGGQATAISEEGLISGRIWTVRASDLCFGGGAAGFVGRGVARLCGVVLPLLRARTHGVGWM